jgi:hypothetical protein
MQALLDMPKVKMTIFTIHIMNSRYRFPAAMSACVSSYRLELDRSFHLFHNKIHSGRFKEQNSIV